jgi:hypothetical protein
VRARTVAEKPTQSKDRRRNRRWTQRLRMPEILAKLGNEELGFTLPDRIK